MARPECVINEIHDSTDNLVARLRKPDIDLAFVVEPLPPAVDLRYEEVYKCTVCCAVSWKHELENLESITLQQLADWQLVAYSKEAYPQYHLYLEKFFKGKVPEIVAECKDHTQLIKHVARTKHVALVPLQMDKHTENRVRLIPIAPEIRVGVGALSVKRPSRLIRDFVRYARQCAK
jgi:DNA-binding transcriptional LysR family regulator